MSAYASVEFDHHPEVVENGQGTRRLELLGIKEELREPHDRRAFFANLNDEDFTRMVGYINSVTRGEKIDPSYTDGTAPTMATPPLEDKKPLMDLTFQTVRDILANPVFDDRQALRRAGLTMAGATGFIHPKEDGSGRMGRVSHYLIEFGTERGDQAFNEEMYGIIGKTRIYDTDTHTALYDTPPAALDRALDAKTAELWANEWEGLSPRHRASARVVTFLDMMRGAVVVPINEDITRLNGLNPDRTTNREYIPAGTHDGLGLYEAEYLRLSEIPNRLPEDVPDHAQRVLADKIPTERMPQEFID